MSLTNFLKIFANFPVFQISDLIDILIVSLIIYLVIAFIRQSRSYFIVYIFLFLFGVNYLANLLNLSLTRQIFQPLLTFVLLFFVVVFQREIRRFFEWFSATGRRLTTQRQIALSSDSAKTIAETVFEMAQKKIGAIIVLPGDYSLDQILEGGFALDGRISRPLLLSIFDTSSPGHDGAIIIDKNRIRRFGVHLPLAEKFSKFASVGTRHRATAGITQRTDSAAIVVSEERGEVSWSEGGDLTKIQRVEELEKLVSGFLKDNLDLSDSRTWYSWITRSWGFKLLSVVLAFVLWSVFVYQIGVTSEVFSIPVEIQYLSKDLVVDEISPTKISVTLSGNYRDLHSLDVTKDLKVLVDAKNLTSGRQRINIDDSNIQYPSYLILLEKEPRAVIINVTKSKNVPSLLPTSTLPII